MTTFDRITHNPLQMGGRPCIRGMRSSEFAMRRTFEMIADCRSSEIVFVDGVN